MRLGIRGISRSLVHIIYCLIHGQNPSQKTKGGTTVQRRDSKPLQTRDNYFLGATVNRSAIIFPSKFIAAIKFPSR